MGKLIDHKYSTYLSSNLLFHFRITCAKYDSIYFIFYTQLHRYTIIIILSTSILWTFVVCTYFSPRRETMDLVAAR